MTKAEEFAIKKYPVSIEDIHGHKVDVNLWQRKACVDGYQQAEKDNELSWEDIREICDIAFEEACRLQRNMKSSLIYKEQHYQEVLKRFKELKENNEKK